MVNLWEHYGVNELRSYDIDPNELLHYKDVENFSKPFDKKRFCFHFQNIDANGQPCFKFQTSYFIGLDWIGQSKLPVYVAPKIDSEIAELDYMALLTTALQNIDDPKHLKGLFTIDFEAVRIPISQQEDLLSPLLYVQFLQLCKTIVKKGLKKSYYRVQKNLQSKVKGKVLVNQTIKKNHLKGRLLNVFCEYDEFGVDILENRFLKRVFLHILKQPSLTRIMGENNFELLINYIRPAFHLVSSDAEERDLPHIKLNPMYKEYQEAIRIGKLILKKESYNIKSDGSQTILSPPFWIDMSKLFELYVFQKLKQRFPGRNEVLYHETINYLEPDFIVNSIDKTYQMVVDAKYKPHYVDNRINKEDIRQVAGYARLEKVYNNYLKIARNEVIDCLIVFSDQNGLEDVMEVDFKSPENKEPEYVSFYKTGIKMPVKN